MSVDSPASPASPASPPPRRLLRITRLTTLVAVTTLVVLATLLAVGCGGGGPDGARPSVQARPVTSDGLELVRSTGRSKLWVRPDHHIGRYDDILVTEIAFAYAQGQEELGPDQEREVGEMLRSAIEGITEGSPVGRASAPGECVVAMRLGLKDIRLHIAETQGSSVSYVSSFGSATMIVEFRDSLSDTALVRYATHRGLGGGPGTGRIGANLTRLGKALGDMVTAMTSELQRIVPDTTVRRETVCNDGIYRMTGRG